MKMGEINTKISVGILTHTRNSKIDVYPHQKSDSGRRLNNDRHIRS